MTERKHNHTRVSLSPLPFEEAVKRLVRVLRLPRIAAPPPSNYPGPEHQPRKK
jgi:hypothetical protein